MSLPDRVLSILMVRSTTSWSKFSRRSGRTGLRPINVSPPRQVGTDYRAPVGKSRCERRGKTVVDGDTFYVSVRLPTGFSAHVTKSLLLAPKKACPASHGGGMV